VHHEAAVHADATQRPGTTVRHTVVHL